MVVLSSIFVNIRESNHSDNSYMPIKLTLLITGKYLFVIPNKTYKAVSNASVHKKPKLNTL